MQLRGVSLGYEIPSSAPSAATSTELLAAAAPLNKAKKAPKVEVKVILNNINLDIDQNSKIAILGSFKHD